MTPDDVKAAAARIAPNVRRTPTLRSDALDRESGAVTYVKAEPLQRTGTFKLRGATNALLSLPESSRGRGVVAYSSGNHAQAVACAAAMLGVPSTIVMPSDAPKIKRAHTERWGARIISYERASEDRAAIAAAAAEETGAAVIPPYDDERVIAGQGTLALELLEDAGPLDIVLVPTGGGGLTAGTALALEAVSPTTKLYGVEPQDWDDTARSLAAGAITQTGGGSQLCDALMARAPGAITFPINQSRLAGMLSVSDEAVLAAMKFAFEHLKLVVEPGGAVALAAARSGALSLAGKRIGIVLSGGNADPAVFARALS